MPAGHGQQQHQRHEPLHREAGGHDAPAMVAVDDMAGQQSQQQRRHELVEADQAQVPGAAREFVDIGINVHKANADQYPIDPTYYQAEVALGEHGRYGQKSGKGFYTY